MVSIKNTKINRSVKKIIKEFKTIWIDGGFTSIAIVVILAMILVPFLPEGNSIMNKCIIG